MLRAKFGALSPARARARIRKKNHAPSIVAHSTSRRSLGPPFPFDAAVLRPRRVITLRVALRVALAARCRCSRRSTDCTRACSLSRVRIGSNGDIVESGLSAWKLARGLTPKLENAISRKRKRADEDVCAGLQVHAHRTSPALSLATLPAIPRRPSARLPSAARVAPLGGST